MQVRVKEEGGFNSPFCGCKAEHGLEVREAVRGCGVKELFLGRLAFVLCCELASLSRLPSVASTPGPSCSLRRVGGNPLTPDAASLRGSDGGGLIPTMPGGEGSTFEGSQGMGGTALESIQVGLRCWMQMEQPLVWSPPRGT